MVALEQCAGGSRSSSSGRSDHGSSSRCALIGGERNEPRPKFVLGMHLNDDKRHGRMLLNVVFRWQILGRGRRQESKRRRGEEVKVEVEVELEVEVEVEGEVEGGGGEEEEEEGREAASGAAVDS